ncbi:Cyanate permease [Micromonospora haikouensis]|uniref:Cyanate permease n=1 Tax=Micromonospora haikouensis TaxID=686309 RepID=A0A1C4XXS3_9ACTN|nr:Cyanate permease [Micromonospora haikouensis]
MYGTLGVLGYLLNGMGAVLGPLQRELNVDRAAVAFYPSLFACALLIIGVVGHRVTIRLGHRVSLWVALCGLATGAVLLTTQARALTLFGAALLGLAGALVVQVVPAALNVRQPQNAAAAVAEANAISSYASVLAPVAVATAVLVGVGWRVGYLLPVLPVAIAMLFGVRRLADREQPGPTDAPRTGLGLEPGPLLGRWTALLLAVSVEFCLVFWSADAFSEWHRVGAAVAPALAALFLLGMAMTRTAAARVTAGRHPLGIVVVACGVAIVGFAVFWAAPVTVLAAVGLLLTGLGISLLYPMTLTRAVAAWPHAPDRAAGRAALASGLAIGIAPLALARLADHVGLRAAFLIVPVLLVVLGGQAALALSGGRRPRSL